MILVCVVQQQCLLQQSLCTLGPQGSALLVTFCVIECVRGTDSRHQVLVTCRCLGVGCPHVPFADESACCCSVARQSQYPRFTIIIDQPPDKKYCIAFLVLESLMICLFSVLDLWLFHVFV